MFGINKNGIKVIDGVVAEFQSTITKLKQGIELCNQEKTENLAEIYDLTEANKSLDSASDKASKFVENLSKLIPS